MPEKRRSPSQSSPHQHTFAQDPQMAPSIRQRETSPSAHSAKALPQSLIAHLPFWEQPSFQNTVRSTNKLPSSPPPQRRETSSSSPTTQQRAVPSFSQQQKAPPSFSEPQSRQTIAPSQKSQYTQPSFPQPKKLHPLPSSKYIHPSPFNEIIEKYSLPNPVVIGKEGKFLYRSDPLISQDSQKTFNQYESLSKEEKLKRIRQEEQELEKQWASTSDPKEKARLEAQVAVLWKHSKEIQFGAGWQPTPPIQPPRGGPVFKAVPRGLPGFWPAMPPPPNEGYFWEDIIDFLEKLFSKENQDLPEGLTNLFVKPQNIKDDVEDFLDSLEPYIDVSPLREALKVTEFHQKGVDTGNLTSPEGSGGFTVFPGFSMQYSTFEERAPTYVKDGKYHIILDPDVTYDIDSRKFYLPNNTEYNDSASTVLHELVHVILNINGETQPSTITNPFTDYVFQKDTAGFIKTDLKSLSQVRIVDEENFVSIIERLILAKRRIALIKSELEINIANSPNYPFGLFPSAKELKTLEKIRKIEKNYDEEVDIYNERIKKAKEIAKRENINYDKISKLFGGFEMLKPVGHRY